MNDDWIDVVIGNLLVWSAVGVVVLAIVSAIG